MAEPLNVQHERLSVTVVTVSSPGDQAREVSDAHVAYASRADDQHDERFLRRASLVLSESLDAMPLRESAVHLPLPYLADWCALHLVNRPSDGGIAPLTVGAHVDPDQEPRALLLWRQAVETTPSAIPSLTRSLCGYEHASRPARIDISITHISEDPRDSPAVCLLARCDFATAVHVPLVAGTHILGVLTLASLTPERYGPRQVALAIAYASCVACVLDRAQRREPAAECLYEDRRARTAAHA